MTSGRWANHQVATVAVEQAGGAERPVHHEAVATKAFELAPDRFSWSLPEYRDLPDKDLVRVSLFDAEKKAKGGHVASSRDGDGNLYWRLTAAGGAFCARYRATLLRSLGASDSQSKRRSHARILSRIRDSRLWKQYEAGALDEASEVLLTELLRIPPDSPVGTIKQSFDHLAAQLSIVRDDTLEAFLDATRSKFTSLLDAERRDVEGES